MSCPAKKKGEVKSRGKASLEFFYRDGEPAYYCYGWIDRKNDELIPTCAECHQNVRFAQEDLDNAIKAGRA